MRCPVRKQIHDFTNFKIRLNSIWLNLNLLLLWGLWGYHGHSHIKRYFWPLDQIKSCFIWLAIVQYEDCYLLFENRSWDTEVIGGQSEELTFFLFLNDHIMFSLCSVLDYWTKHCSHIINIVSCVRMVSVQKYELCRIPFKYRYVVKKDWPHIFQILTEKSDHIRPKWIGKADN